MRWLFRLKLARKFDLHKLTRMVEGLEANLNSRSSNTGSSDTDGAANDDGSQRVRDESNAQFIMQ